MKCAKNIASPYLLLILTAAYLTITTAVAVAPLCTGTGSGSANINCMNVIVFNGLMDVGEHAYITLNGISAASAITANWFFLPPPSSNIPIGNTIEFGPINTITGNTIMGINAFSPNEIAITFNTISDSTNSNSLYIFNPIFSNSITNTIIGQWTFNGVLTSASNTLDTNSIPQITIYPELSSGSPLGLHVIFDTNSLPITQHVNGGDPAYTYNWFAGEVPGGYDKLQLSLIPSFYSGDKDREYCQHTRKPPYPTM